MLISVCSTQSSCGKTVLVSMLESVLHLVYEQEGYVIATGDNKEIFRLFGEKDVKTSTSASLLSAAHARDVRLAAGFSAPLGKYAIYPLAELTDPRTTKEKVETLTLLKSSIKDKLFVLEVNGSDLELNAECIAISDAVILMTDYRLKGVDKFLERNAVEPERLILVVNGIDASLGNPMNICKGYQQYKNVLFLPFTPLIQGISVSGNFTTLATALAKDSEQVGPYRTVVDKIIDILFERRV